MNEIKRAREQLDARNGLQRKQPKKKKKLRIRRKKVRRVQQSRQPQQSARQERKKQQALQKKQARQAKKARRAQAKASRKKLARSSRPEQKKTADRRALSRTSPLEVPGAPQEERLNARRETARRHRRRRKKNYILYYIILFIFIVTAGIILSLTVFFNIGEIRVEGNTRYAVDEIVACSGIEIGNNLFRISTGDAEERIVESFVYLDKVEVKRDFPDKLVISVTEAQPAMSFASGFNYVLVSAQGRVLETGCPAAESSVIVTGADVSDYKVGDFILSEDNPSIGTLQTIRSLCSEKGITGLSRVDLRSIVDIRIFVEDRLRIDAGSVTDLEYKLTFAKEIISTRLSETDRGVIDVKQPGKAYFRPAEDLFAS